MATVDIRTGSEGPPHDPYGYKEITVTRDSPHFRGSVMIHLGLGEWMELNGRRVEAPLPNLLDAFEARAGVSPMAAERAVQKLRLSRLRAHPCGMGHLAWMSGYPGESLLCCRKCKAVLDATFNKSAVE